MIEGIEAMVFEDLGQWDNDEWVNQQAELSAMDDQADIGIEF